MTVKWEQSNLDVHFDKHPAGKDKECWKDLLAKTTSVTKLEYEAESIHVCDRCWLKYEAEHAKLDCIGTARRQGLDIPYNEKRKYFVDDKLLTTITSKDGESIITCFHEHFGRPHEQHDHKSPVAELRDKLRKKLEYNEKSKMMRNVVIQND